MQWAVGRTDTPWAALDPSMPAAADCRLPTAD